MLHKSMNAKKICGLLFFIAGAILFIVAQYVKTQVEEGREKISNAQETLDKTTGIFSLSPTIGAVGKHIITDPAQKKIQAGEAQAAHYSSIANGLQIAGILLVALGVGTFLVGLKSG